MSKMRCCLSSTLVLLASLGTARGEDLIVVPGHPPLTQSMVEDYCRLTQWRAPEAFARLGGAPGLRQVLANDWKNGDTARQKVILADLKWWRDYGAKQNRGQHPPARHEAAILPPDGAHKTPGADGRLSVRDQQAIHLARLQWLHHARQQHIRALSNLQASHHETMMVIIDNMRPSGRYEYNPVTNRYDRWVPYPRRR